MIRFCVLIRFYWHFKNPAALRIVYNSSILSHLEYASVIWSFTIDLSGRKLWEKYSMNSCALCHVRLVVRCTAATIIL